MIKPTMNKIVIKLIKEEDKTSGGLFIPDSAKEVSQKGEVVAVGQGKFLDNGERQSLEINVGDVVLYTKYSGTDFKLEGQEYKILSVDDVLATIGE